MPRPNLNPKKAGVSSGSKYANPFVNWLANRQERRREAEDEASRLITNKIAENENIIIDKLESIDFFNSRLPKNVLESKSRPDQPCGDLEYAARGIVRMLRKNPQTIKMDPWYCCSSRLLSRVMCVLPTPPKAPLYAL